METTIQTIIKNNLIHYYKKITYSRGYKKIEYLYDLLENNEPTRTLCHNIKNPAVIVYSNNKIVRLEYWFKGELHREYKPAVILLSDNKVTSEIWYHNNVKLSDEEVQQIKNTIDRRKKIMNILYKTKLKKTI